MASKRVVPVIKGGEDLEFVLNHISEQIDELTDREQKGEDVEVEKQKLEDEKKRVQALKNEEDNERGGKSEVETLRGELRKHQRQDLAKAISREIVERIQKDEDEERQELAQMVRSEVSELLGGGDIEGVVAGVVKSMRTPSRFVGQGASNDLVDHVANGGSVRTVDNNNIRVDEKGAKAEAKAILESKSIASFFSILSRVERSELFLSDGEKEFFRTHVRGVTGKAMAEMTDSAGGYLVPIEWMDDILGLLRAQAIVRKANPREIPFNKLMNQTSISSGASASYTGENARITPSELTFAEAPLLTPKNLTALVPVSNYLLADAPQAEALIRTDMTQVMALREDLAFLRGTGAGGEPVGLRNKASITLNPITVPTNGFQPSIADLRRIKAYYRTNNAGAVRLAWFFPPQFLTYMETLTDPDGRFLLDSALLTYNEDGVSGRVDGTPFYMSTQIPTNLTVGSWSTATDLMLVNLEETIVGMNQELEIAVSNQASWSADGTTWNWSFQQNQTLFRAVLRRDIAHRRPSQIIVQTGVLV